MTIIKNGPNKFFLRNFVRFLLPPKKQTVPFRFISLIFLAELDTSHLNLADLSVKFTLMCELGNPSPRMTVTHLSFSLGARTDATGVIGQCWWHYFWGNSHLFRNLLRNKILCRLIVFYRWRIRGDIFWVT